MKINIKGTNLELTPAITQYIEDKIGSLDRYAENMEKDGDPALGHEIVEAFVEIGRTTKHHRQGDIYKAEVNLKIGGQIIRTEKEDWDIRVAVDAVKEDLKIELEKFKGKRNTKYKQGARLVKRALSISPLAWFKKEK